MHNCLVWCSIPIHALTVVLGADLGRRGRLRRELLVTDCPKGRRVIARLGTGVAGSKSLARVREGW
ncbi:hypothetical protein JOE57_000653 [Microlunatus panaciterrae]|uniref:Secreted protein n=1 Tax=Microlunatus panaciterrae TaxID=400768 RepID=A0ABS2RFJ1_9ACTN|nr:hypothetical protein [Microlunatus panaciterrae]